MTKDNKPDIAQGWDEEFEIPTYEGKTPAPKKEAESGSGAEETVSLPREEKLPRESKPTAADSESQKVTGPVKDSEVSEQEQKQDLGEQHKAAESPRSSVFDRPGRAAPQHIEPVKKVEETPTAAPLSGDDTATTAFAAAGSAGAGVGAAAGDSRESYGDEDFATTVSESPAQYYPQTQHLGAEGGNETAGQFYPAQAGVEGEPEASEQAYSAAPAGARRGTIDLGLFFVRLAVAAYLIVAGISTFFDLGASGGLAGLESELASYAASDILAIAVPTLQLISGVFLLLGLITPLAAMVGLVVTGFMALHTLAISGAGFNVLAWEADIWLPMVLFGLTVALQFTGPGVISLDFSRSWTRRPLASSWIFVVLGIAGVVAAWWLLAGVNPLA